MIVVDNLTKAFRDSRGVETFAVDRVSFQCRPGEIFGLLGLNGAGKTTTMRMISTVLRPTSGTAIVAGYDVRYEPAQVRKKIGFLSGSTALYDRMSAWEHVDYFGRLYEIPSDLLQDRMEHLFQSLQMNHFRDMLVSKMSTGMKQKVSIARALIHDPPVLVFDEPTSGLDVLVQRAVLDQISQLRDAGKCILYSTHIMREVEKLCDRIGIIHRGRVLTIGSLDELLSSHPGDDLEEIFFQLVSPEAAASS
jgi:sodium transport system ATP-binding protein